ncbi:MAG: hypothetical protein KBA31_19015 [Alphaproteobacteria bacterium]|nr:hypothetical protein [Alphaproteobacteria bacterium]
MSLPPLPKSAGSSAPRRFREDIPAGLIGLVGEIDVRRELAAEGWLTINANTERGNFPNVDLVATRGIEARSIQVKTSNAERGSHAHCLFMGRAQGWLESETPFYNSKTGPLRCSVVVLVHASRARSRFVVLPVAVAEHIARRLVEEWRRVPKRDGQVRSAGFDARPQFTRLKTNATPLDARVQEVLRSFEDRWDVLDRSVDELETVRAWGVDLKKR